MAVGTWIALAFLVAGAVYGAAKGALKMILGLAGWLVILLCLFFVTPHVNRFLSEQTPLETFIYDKTEGYIRRQSSQLWMRIAESSGEAAEEAAEEQTGGLLDEVRSRLPAALNEKIDALGEAIVSGTTQAVESAKEAADQAAQQTITSSAASVAAVWTRYLMQGISLLFTWLGAKLLLLLLKGLIHLIDKAPVIHGISHFFGAVLGALIGVLYLWAALLAADLLSLTAAGTQAALWIQSSPLLSAIAAANPLMELLH